MVFVEERQFRDWKKENLDDREKSSPGKRRHPGGVIPLLSSKGFATEIIQFAIRSYNSLRISAKMICLVAAL